MLLIDIWPGGRGGGGVFNPFSCSTQMNMKFKLLIKTKTLVACQKTLANSAGPDQTASELLKKQSDQSLPCFPL